MNTDEPRDAVPHPMQPVILLKGVIRFKANAIVRYLLDSSKDDLNSLALMPFSAEDWNQFAQLIGYSVSGFGDLSYVFPETVEAADREAEKLLEAQK